MNRKTKLILIFTACILTAAIVYAAKGLTLVTSEFIDGQLQFQVKATKAQIMEINSNNYLELADSEQISNSSDQVIITADDNDCTLVLKGYEAKDAILLLQADESDDNGDDWQIKAAQSGNALTFSNDTSGSQVAKLTISTAGDVTIANDLTVTGHIATQVILINSMIAIDADWTLQADGAMKLALNLTSKALSVQLSGLKVGDEITGYRIVGGLGATTGSATVLDAAMYRTTKGAGGASAAAITGGSITQVSTEADAALDSAATLSATETVATDYQYFVLVTGTTANNAACDIDIIGVELLGNFKP